MPFYEYRCVDGPGCSHCQSGLVVLQKLDAATVEHCPHCQARVSKVISAVNVPAKGTPTLSRENIEKAGFTQYKKVEKGVYEKTAGRGPRVIAGDD